MNFVLPLDSVEYFWCGCSTVCCTFVCHVINKVYLCTMQIPIESLNLLMLNVGYAQHDGDWNWQNVSSPFTRIYYVTKGTARVHLPKGVVELTPGHLYMIPQHTLHGYECEGVFEHFYLHVYEGFKQETDVFDYYDFPTEVDAEDLDCDLLETMCRLHPDAQLPASDPTSYDNRSTFTDYVRRYNELELYDKMQLRGMILMLFSRFMRRAQPRVWTKDERLLRVLEYIHSNIYKDISVDVLASEACVTKPYLIRIFTKNFGISPLQYINQKKMEKAQLLLITDDLPVKELAYVLGYNDHSYFTRLFKKLIGVTPMEYRLSMR